MQYGLLLHTGNPLRHLGYGRIRSITFLLTSIRPVGPLFGTWRCKRLSAPETEQTTYRFRRFKMQVSKLIIALTVAAGFASTSFAQGAAAPAPQAAPAAKVNAPAAAAAEKKIEAPKAAEPAKAEAKVEAAKPEAGKPAEKHAKSKSLEHKGEQSVKAEVKPEAKPAPAPAAK
jgi:hypothetical protein